MLSKKALKVFTVVIGVFFLLSGFGKAIDTTAFSSLIYSYGFGYLMVLAPFIVVAEIALGASLVLLLNPKRDTLIALLFLISFTSAFGFAHFHNGINDCGCFGTLRPSSLGPNESFIQNFILMILAILVWRKYPAGEPSRKIVLWKKGLIAFLLVAGIFISGLTFSMPAMLHGITHRNKFKNQNIHNTELARYVKTSAVNRI